MRLDYFNKNKKIRIIKMKIQQLKRGDSIIEYSLSRREGEDTVVFLHGLGAMQDQFALQHRFFSQKFQVLSLNVAGHGGSTPKKDFTLPACADDVVALLDELGIDKVHFIGNSMGGNIGYELVKRYEQRLRSFTTFGTTAELKVGKGAVKIIRFMYKLISSKMLGSMSGSVGRTKESKEVIKKMMTKMNKAVILDILPELSDLNYLDVIAKSEVPALIIRGDKDAEINRTLSSAIETFQQRGRFRLVELNDAGHFANLDAPDEFNNRLLGFIESVSS